MFPLLRNSIEKFILLTDAEWQMLVPALEIRHLKNHELLAEEGKIANEVGASPPLLFFILPLKKATGRPSQ